MKDLIWGYCVTVHEMLLAHLTEICGVRMCFVIIAIPLTKQQAAFYYMTKSTGVHLMVNHEACIMLRSKGLYLFTTCQSLQQHLAEITATITRYPSCQYILNS